MDILKMLAEFRAERQRIEEAILALERLAGSFRGKRRGRPPKWISTAIAEGAPTLVRKKRTVSAAARKRMAAAQKKRWAARKAQTKASSS
jgi:hypothetical protein